MKIIYLLILMMLVVAACSSATQDTPTTLPKPTDPPETTATATEPVERDTAPTPTATFAPQATSTEIPADTPPAQQINFTSYEANPILEKGEKGDWDYFRAMGARVLHIDDTFHMFYGGWGEETSGIGYAQSPDGLSFTKHESNPIFQPDGEGFDALSVRLPTPLVIGDTWMLYYNTSSTGDDSLYEVGPSVGLTTAPEPTGPWTQGQLVLKPGGPVEWDSGFVIPNSVITTEDGFRMYYTGGKNPDQVYIQVQDDERSGAMCGMATSTDGINWTKYDDPSTTEAPYAESDPVLGPSSSGWDTVDVKCSVMKTNSGWEMLYKGLGTAGDGLNSKFGYATSQDGVNWTKFAENPIFQSNQDRLARNTDLLIEPSALKDGSTYYLYFSYGGNAMEGVATGIIEAP